MNSKGVILIEFAVCMPVLIILLFYINDLVKLKRYYSQTEFVAQQMANMIQNVSQKKTDKKITKEDYTRIVALAWQTVYPGESMFSSTRQHYPEAVVYYIKGLSDGKAVIKYYFYSIPQTTKGRFTYHIGGTCRCNSKIRVSYRTNVYPEQIHPNLKINPGEVKILIQAYFVIPGSTKLFRLLTPSKQCDLACFHSSVIFTPKAGLFTDDIVEEDSTVTL